MALFNIGQNSWSKFWLVTEQMPTSWCQNFVHLVTGHPPRWIDRNSKSIPRKEMAPTFLYLVGICAQHALHWGIKVGRRNLGKGLLHVESIGSGCWRRGSKVTFGFKHLLAGRWRRRERGICAHIKDGLTNYPGGWVLSFNCKSWTKFQNVYLLW